MSTSSKHFRREQRLALRVAIGIVVLVLVLVIPLVLSGALRLRLAHEFGFAPGEGVPQIAGANQNIDLLVAPVMQADTRTDGRSEPSSPSTSRGRNPAGSCSRT